LDLTDVCDLHLHTGPDVRERWYDDIENARIADSMGMYAILLKTHWTCTADRAIVAARYAAVEKVKVYGGVSLDYAVGGVNREAVAKALEMGAKEVWLPTHDARHHRQYHGSSGGISIVRDDDPSKLRDDVAEIVDMAGQKGAIIGTGHVSIEEIYALLRFCRPLRYKVLVTHPELYTTRVPLSVQREFAALGGILERGYIACTDWAGSKRTPIAEVAAEIRELGPASSVLCSDLGLRSAEKPFEGLWRFFELLREHGVSQADIDVMSKVRPRELLEA
jgi:hypothetical protein